MKYTDALFIIRFFGHRFPTRTIIIKIPKVILFIILTLFATGCLAPLHKAVNDGNINAAAAELDKGADVNKTDWGASPLGTAVYHGDVNMVKLLLDRGAQLDDVLYNAIFNCHLNVIKLLLERGAKVEQYHFSEARKKCDTAVILLNEAQLKQLNKKPGDKPKTIHKGSTDML